MSKGFQTSHPNTCYFCAILQGVVHTPPLTMYILHEHDDEPGDTPLKKFLHQYTMLCRQYFQSDQKGLNIDSLKKTFNTIHTIFDTVEQQDCGEAYIYLLETLHDSMKIKQRFQTTSVQLQDDDRKQWDMCTTDNYSLITEIFQFQIKYTILEQDAPFARQPYINTNYEHCYSLSLPITANNLVDILKNYLLPEKDLEIDSEQNPGSKIRVTKHIQLTHIPLTMVLQLKRFDNMSNKIETLVDYPLQFTMFQNEYKLFAVVIHTGRHYSGHYYSLCNFQDSWFHVDNDLVVPLGDTRQIVHRDAYMFFYKRIS